MVESELDIGGFESLAEFKKSVQQEKIRNLVLAEYMKTPIGKEPNRKTLSKNLKISEASISDAFRDVEKAKQENDFSSAITKALGIATPMLLLQEENINKLSNFLNDNEELAAMAGGLYLAWNNFVKPRIDDPKNDLSELEVIVELFKSQVGQAFVGGIFGLLTTRKLINDLLPRIDTFGNKIQDGLTNFGLGVADVVEDIKEITENAKTEFQEFFGLDAVICLVRKNGVLEVFAAHDDWLDSLDLLERTFYRSSIGFAAGIALYMKLKIDFIKACSPNVVRYNDYLANPSAYQIIEEEEEEIIEQAPPVVGGGGGEVEPPKGAPKRIAEGAIGTIPEETPTTPIVAAPVVDVGKGISMGESVPSRGGIIKIEPESLVIKKI